MYKKLYNFHSDSGHGWLEVKLQELWDLDIYKKVTQFSYEKRGTVYLEEDHDAPLFYMAYKEVNGHYPEIKEVIRNGSSPIREYPRFVTSYNWK